MESVRDLIPMDVIYACAYAKCWHVFLHGQGCDQADLIPAVFSVIKLATLFSWSLASTMLLSITHLVVQGHDRGSGPQWTVGYTCSTADKARNHHCKKKQKNIDRRFSRQYSMMAATNNFQLCCICSAFPNGFGCTFNIGHVLHHGIANTTLYVKGLKLTQWSWGMGWGWKIYIYHKLWPP